MKLTKKIVALAVSVVAVAATTISASAYYIYTFTPNTTLKANGVLRSSNTVHYGMSYNLADTTPYFSMTIPANVGSGTVTVYYDYYHDYLKDRRSISNSFSSSSSSQYIYKTGNVIKNIPVATDEDLVTDFRGVTNNNSVKNTSIYATYDVKYH